MVASPPPALAEALVQAQLKQLGALPKLALPETVRRFPPGLEATLNPWIRFFNVPPSVHMARLAAFIMASGSVGAIVGFACGCAVYRALVQGKDSVLSGKIAAMLARYRAKMRLSNEGVEAFQQDFLKQMEDGLPQQNGAGPNGDPYGSSLLMLPSFVTKLPSGMETGQFFAIDLGGTNFRMQNVRLSARRSEIDRDMSRGTEIPEHLYSGTTTQLFDFLASSLVEFAREEAGWRPGDAQPVVGFCFSFPMHQTALNKASLIQWTKGFTCSGGVGEDPVELLSAALARAGMPSTVAAVLNDTIGVWAAHRYRNAATAIGLILGTGSNACYVEREGGETVIDIEWGGFSSATVPRIEEDEQLDEASPNAGEMQFEKLFSGLYLGEIARRILLKVLGETGFSPATLPAPITTPGAFASATVSAIVEDRSWNLATTRKLLRGHLQVPQELLSILTRPVREICELVAMRGVDLVAAALVAVVRRGGWYKEPGECVVAVDGSVYEKFHSFRQQLHCRAEQLLARLPQRHPGFKLVFEMESSSCMGAAVLAAAATAS